MVIVHDDDLARLDLLGDGTVSRKKKPYDARTVLIFSRMQSLETLQPEIVLNCLRSSKLAIHEVVFDPGESFPCRSFSKLKVFTQRRQIYRLTSTWELTRKLLR